MIRLGSLAGYPFEGPRLLVGWTAPAAAAVYAVLYRPRPDTHPEQYAVIYAGHSDNLAAEGFPFRHPRAGCWTKRAGDRFKVYVAVYDPPGARAAHREQITQELIAAYRPGCNSQQYDQRWEPEWIGSYQAPTADPLTTRKQPPGTGPTT
ncbi:hypothetical protein I6A84_13145 [Frankia sp. CNm7]|uniref:Uncharacterized protein n=1 Tax=Frankia nepalensis TaxID=1836974 RepID=A0A937RNW0_9ACTN|nr:hypothetical protein [Frankia nepalensis]MBL7497926.1 hypothetical protein [Frankia nepalensis]MBL7512705.1 hypothetical protein [Frankia nepalensis]MBL7519024.1 hypothetical protein [Frankia nepalensis]MBL7629918.1 hypothetical protein [Frankia nepalensis]